MKGRRAEKTSPVFLKKVLHVVSEFAQGAHGQLMSAPNAQPISVPMLPNHAVDV